MNLYESIKKNLKESVDINSLAEKMIAFDKKHNPYTYDYPSHDAALQDNLDLLSSNDLSDPISWYEQILYDKNTSEEDRVIAKEIVDALYELARNSGQIKESVKVGPIYRLGTEDYITSYNDIRLDEVGITLEDIELFKRVDTSESAPDKVNYLLYVDMRWDGDDTMTVPVAYNISDNEYEEEINPPMLGIYDEDLDSEVYNAVDEVVRNLALKISQSGRLTESTETRLANLGVKGKKPELKTVVLDGKEMMDYLKNDMEGKFPEFEKQITDDDHMIYFLTDLDKGKWDFDKMRIEEKVDSICPVCGDHHRFVKEENGKIYYSCPLCKYDEDKDNIYESEKSDKSYGQYPSSHIYEFYPSKEEARKVADFLKKEGKYTVEKIFPLGDEFGIWVHYKREEGFEEDFKMPKEAYMKIKEAEDTALDKVNKEIKNLHK